ncbi:7158_t:CDS:2, partial [Racocetra fulgida]
MYGDIALWNLDEKRLSHIIKGAHDGLIPSIQFLNGQPILLTSGADNSIKEWIFDSLDGVEPRLLKSRSGHHAPPTKIEFYGSDGHFILSAAGDRSLRAFSFIRDSQSVELSQAEVKQKEWDNIISCHMNNNGARTWSFQSKVIGKHVLRTFDGSHIKIWDFNTAKVKSTIEIESPISVLRFHTENDLLAVVSDDLCIRVIDVETNKVIREFWGHKNRITDLTFSPDGRWIVSTSLDATIRTWDLPTGHLVDIFRVENVPTSITFSPNGDFLATSHVDLVGIFLCVTLRRIDDDNDISLVELPTTLGIEDNNEDLFVSNSNETNDVSFETPEQLTEQMITLSSLPKSKWQNLLNLETIKEPPKAPERPPFFLPTLPGVDPKFVPSISLNESEKEKKQKGGKTLNAIKSRLKSKKDFELVQAYLNHFLKIYGDIITSNYESLG